MKLAAVLAVFATCGTPSVEPLDCPPSAVERSVCRQCAPNDACLKAETICAPVCSSPAECSGDTMCLNGACVPYPCG